MKQSLQLRLTQQLTMTPQLQQAIRLLQLSTLELQTEVQEALDSNVMLEVDDGEPDAGPEPEGEDPLNGHDTSREAPEAREEQVEPADIPSELAVDSVWDDVYDGGTYLGKGGDDGSDYEVQRSATGNLRDHVNEQVDLATFSDTDRVIALALVDAINDDGYLAASVDEIHESLAGQGLEVELDEVEAVLRQIQNFDPPGVAARDLGECLIIQLGQLSADTRWRDAALRLVRDHLDVLAARDYSQLMRVLNLEEDDLRDVIALIQSLAPRPGSLVETSLPEYVIPDVFVRRDKDAWVVELNADAFPRLRVNAFYANLLRQIDDSGDKSTLKSHLQEARWFIKSLRSRSETLLKVSTCIVERQQAFFENGEEAMKPMTLHDVAEAVGMHESTISRVTTQKYMHSPRGIFELKYFFSSHVYTNTGQECSSTAIRALLKKLIAEEPPRHPHSDSRLAKILSELGINVARRTVAKYRESLTIPSSNERRSLN